MDGCPPNSGPLAGFYGAYQQPPYYSAHPAVAPLPAAKGDDGNSWGRQIPNALIFFASDSTGHGLGNNARERVKTSLIIIGIGIAAIAVLVVVLGLMQ